MKTDNHKYGAMCGAVQRQLNNDLRKVILKKVEKFLGVSWNLDDQKCRAVLSSPDFWAKLSQTNIMDKKHVTLEIWEACPEAFKIVQEYASTYSDVEVRTLEDYERF